MLHSMSTVLVCALWMLVVACGAPAGEPNDAATSQDAATSRDAAQARDSAAAPDARGPHTVSACPAADSDVEVGEWVSITPSEVHIEPDFGGFNTGVVQFVLDPSDTATIYLGTHSQ